MEARTIPKDIPTYHYYYLYSYTNIHTRVAQNSSFSSFGS